MRLPEDTKDYKAGFCGGQKIRRAIKQDSAVAGRCLGARDEYQAWDGGRGTVSMGVKHPFGMFYAHASKKCRQVFSFPGFPPMIALISVGGKRQLSCFLPIEKAKLGGKQLNS